MENIVARSSRRRARFLSALVAAVGLVSPTSFAAPAGSTGGAENLSLSVQRATLENGLRVVMNVDHGSPNIAVCVTYDVGSRNEISGRSGFAHLFEHMMFQGSKHVPANMHFKMLEGAGASGINGTTDFDRTNYFETLPASELELALWLESDRMGYQIDKLDQANLSNQQDVVRNERRQSVENQPYGLAEEAVVQSLYPPGHPYYGNVIGSHEDIQAVKLGDVQNFFHQYYAPNNASLAIVGDIDVAQTKALVEKYFGSLKRGPDVPKITAETPKITAERRKVVPSRVELPRVYMAWHSPAMFGKGDAEADLLADLLANGKTSRLYRTLVYDKRLALDVSAYQHSREISSFFLLASTAAPGQSLTEITALIDERIQQLADDGPVEQEMERGLAQAEAHFMYRLQTVGGFGGKSDQLNAYNVFLKEPAYFDRDLERYQVVTGSSLRQVVNGYLDPGRRVTLSIVPQGRTALAAPDSETVVVS